MSNSLIIDELLSTADYYDSIGDEGRSVAYRRAVESIEKYDKPIRNGDEAKQLKWIGDGIAAKIDDILQTSKGNNTNNMIKTKNDNNERKNREKTIIDERPIFVSLERSDKRYDNRSDKRYDRQTEKLQNEKNIGEIENLLKYERKPTLITSKIRNESKITKEKYNEKPNEHKINPNLNRQVRTLRVKQYEYMNKPVENAAVVSRNELSFFVSCVKKVWEKIIKKHNPKHLAVVECCGSYRRNEHTCHECILLLKSDIPIARLMDYFKQFIHILKKLHLLNPNNEKNDINYWKGILDLSYLFIDSRTNQVPTKPTNLPIIIKLIEPESWPCALLYWTGPASYWTRLQGAASRTGYELNEYGLYVKVGRKRLKHRDEYDVAMDIGIEYQEPMFRK